MSTVFKTLFYISAAACIAFAAWAVASYIDVLSYDVNLPCNLLEWALEVTAH